jgi:hypothetical protein
MPVFSDPLPERSATADRKHTAWKQILTQGTTRWISERPGSYTNLNELFESDETFSVDLQSGWATDCLFPERNLPGFRLRIIRNLETGEYKPSGGAVTLPGGSWEAGYETDPGTGENKATLQWKKSF